MIKISQRKFAIVDISRLPFLIHRKYGVLLKRESNDSYELKLLRKDAHLSGNATKVA